MSRQKLTIEQFATADGGYDLPGAVDGCGYEDFEQLVMSGVLGFCGCGSPEKAAGFLLDVLRHIAAQRVMCDSPEWGEMSLGQRGQYYRKRAEDREALMGRSEMLVLYWLDKEGYSEHGSSVNGCWLTDKGYELLEMLELWNSQDEQPE